MEPSQSETRSGTAKQKAEDENSARQGGTRMARFKGDIQGARGNASRLGSADSGMTAHVRGWDSGIRISAYAEGDADVFHVYASRGSNGGMSSGFPIGVLREENGRLTFEPASS